MSVTITKSEYAKLLTLIADSRAKAKEAEDLLEGFINKQSESGVKSKKAKSKQVKFNLDSATDDELSKMKVVDLKKLLGEYITIGGGFRRKEDIVNSLIYVRDHPNATQDEIINCKTSKAKASKAVPKAKASKAVPKAKASKAKAVPKAKVKTSSKKTDFKVEDGEGYSWKMIEGVKFVIPLDGSNVVIGKLKPSGVGPFTKADEDILKERKIDYEKLKAPAIKTRISEAKEAMQSGEKSTKKKSKDKSSNDDTVSMSTSSSKSRLLTSNSSDTSSSDESSSSSEEKSTKDDESSSSSEERSTKDDESSSSSEEEKSTKDDESSSSSEEEKSTKDDESSSSSEEEKDEKVIAVTREHYLWFSKHKDDLDEDEFINDFDVSEKEAGVLLKDLNDNFDKLKLQFDPPKPKKPRGIAGKGRGRGKVAMKYVKK